MNGVRVVIPYWFGWGPFACLVFWNLMNLQMGYWQWQDISSGIIGPRSWDKLHLDELFAVVGLFMVLWLAAGREVITLDSSHVRIRKEILGLGWSRKLELSDTRWIQVGGFLDPKAAGKWNPDHVRAALYFSCRGKVRSFRNELTMEDAVRIEGIIQRFLNAHGNDQSKSID